MSLQTETIYVYIYWNKPFWKDCLSSIHRCKWVKKSFMRPIFPGSWLTDPICRHAWWWNDRQYNIQPATYRSARNPTFLSRAQNTTCLVERLKQNLQSHEYLALLLMAHQRGYQRWTVSSLFSAQAWWKDQNKGRGISLSSFFSLNWQWAVTHCSGTADRPCWLFCLLFYLVRGNRSICSTALIQAMQSWCEVEDPFWPSSVLLLLPFSFSLSLMQVLVLEASSRSGQQKSLTELERLWTSPATRIILHLPICCGISRLQEMVWI